MIRKLLNVGIIISILLVNLKNHQIQGTPSKENKTFWQITDIHWDVKYSLSGDKLRMCHSGSKATSTVSDSDIGPYGSFYCDSPWNLVNATIHNMKSLHPKPQFILWTGDNAPHIAESATFPIIYQNLNNITTGLVNLFGNDTIIIPVLGNHDTFPKDEYPATSEEFYGKYLNEGGWSKVIPSEAHQDFKKGGFYRRQVSSGVSVLALNTNLYFASNPLGINAKDPSGQFQWLRTQLEKAVKTKTKVFVAAHSPPGYFERSPVWRFLNATYNDAYVDLLNEFGSVIVAQIYGHLHTDSFRIFRSKGKPQSVAFLSPSVTPWHPFKITGATGMNPSIRLYEYDASTVVDFRQFHLNLTAANHSPDKNCSSKDEADCSKPRFELYYRATEFFGVNKLNSEMMSRALVKLSTNDPMFQQYFAINSGGNESIYCNETCKRNFLCALDNLKESTLETCLKQTNKTNSNDGPRASESNTFVIPLTFDENETLPFSHAFMAVTVTVTAIAIVVLLFIAVAVLIFSHKRKNILASGAKLAEWGGRSASGYSPLNAEAD